MQQMQFGWIEVLLVLGSGQGIFLALVLLRRQGDNRPANRVLAVLLLLGAYHLFIFSMSLSGNILRFLQLVGTGFPLVYLTGPLYYIYVRALLEGRLRLRLYDLLHLLPFFYIVNAMAPLYWLPNPAKIGYIWSVYLIDSGPTPVPQRVVSMFLLHVAQMTGYFLTCRWLIGRRERELRGFLSDSTQFWRLVALGRVTAAFGAHVLAFGFLFLFLVWTKAYGLIVDSLWAFSQAVFMHAIGYVALTQPVLFWGEDLLSTGAAASARVLPARPAARPGRYEKSGLSAEQSGYQYARLRDLMETQGYYLQRDLRLPTLAVALGITPNQLSQVINQRANQSFYDFVNEYRINHAKRLLLNGGQDTVLDIALSVGFNSKATFNRVFKQYTRMTPTDFVRRAASGQPEQ